MPDRPNTRMTRQRRVAMQAVDRLDGAFTVDALAAAVRRIDPACASTSTVYRAVSAMEASGFIERVGSRDGAALFARCDTAHHHHHIVCESCGRVETADCPLAAVAPAGFLVTRHEVTVYGLCPRCAGGAD